MTHGPTLVVISLPPAATRCLSCTHPHGPTHTVMPPPPATHLMAPCTKSIGMCACGPLEQACYRRGRQAPQQEAVCVLHHATLVCVCGPVRSLSSASNSSSSTEHYALSIRVRRGARQFTCAAYCTLKPKQNNRRAAQAERVKLKAAPALSNQAVLLLAPRVDTAGDCRHGAQAAAR